MPTLRCGPLALALVLLGTARLPAQETASSPRGLRTFRGLRDCELCHLKGLAKTLDPKLEALGIKAGTDDNWVLADEIATWGIKDKHAQAFTSLLNERSQRMEKRLGVAEIHRDKRCLACHTAFPLAAMGGDPHLMPAELANDLKVAQGVSCEGCHAPSGDAHGDARVLAGWFKPHIEKDTWRFAAAAEKRDKYGFTDIRSPVARTRLCLSCHLGHAAEGKIVTHEMYAAGHPPLPGFELSTFVEQMPKHWRSFDTKSDIVRTEYLAKGADDIYDRRTYHVSNLHQTQAILVATLVSLSENLKLTGSLADEKFATPVLKPDWPELAQFECFACHHDLKDRGWRQRRTLRGTPGRPMLRAWPVALAKLALKTNGSDPNELDAGWRAVDKLLNEQPFGRTDHWPDAIKPLTQWLDAQAAALERKPIRRDAGLTVLKDLAAVADSDFWDYDSARQLVWAAQVLRDELKSDHSDAALRAQVAALDADMAEIERLFVLKLTDGRKATQTLPGAAKSREVLEVDLEETLKPIAKYDAVEFRERFRKLASKLK